MKEVRQSKWKKLRKQLIFTVSLYTCIRYYLYTIIFQYDKKTSISKHSKKKQTRQYHPLCRKKTDQLPSPKQRLQQSWTVQNKKNIPDKEDSENSSNASKYSQSSSSTVKMANAQQEMEIDMVVKPPLTHQASSNFLPSLALQD